MEASLNQGVQIRVSYGRVGGAKWWSPITNVITRAVVCGSSLQGEQLIINLRQESGKTSTPQPPLCCPPKGQTLVLVIPHHPQITHGAAVLLRSIPVNGYAHMKRVSAQTERWVRNMLLSDALQEICASGTFCG